METKFYTPLFVITDSSVNLGLTWGFTAYFCRKMSSHDG